MDGGETEDGVDPQPESWDEFVRRVNEFVDSGELENRENVYKRDIAHDVAGARKEMLNCYDDKWPPSLKKALRPKHPVHEIALDDFNTWCMNHPDKARKALQAIWTERPLSVAERIRAFSDKLPRPEIKGGTGTRTTLASALLMGLNVTQFPPFMTTIFGNAYEHTGYEQPRKEADEAEVYEHALGFLDQFIKEARARGARLRHRLDVQSVVWHWRHLPDDLPLLGLPFPECSNSAVTENDYDGWNVFARRVNDLVSSDGWNKKQIAPKLKIEGMAKQARTAVLTDADNWADLVKRIFTGEYVYYINREKVRSWIDASPEDALKALKASWTEGNLSEEQRIREFCKRFPEEIISGIGSRLTVAATLLATYDAKRFPPFSKLKYDNAYRQTGYNPPEQNADEAALYVHAPGRLHLNWVRTSKCSRILFQVGVRHREMYERWHVDGEFNLSRRLRA